MSTVPPEEPKDPSEPRWRARYDKLRPRGVSLDPTVEPVRGVSAYPTSYVPGRVLVSDLDRLPEILAELRRAAGEFGWNVVPTDRYDEEQPDVDGASRSASESRPGSGRARRPACNG